MIETLILIVSGIFQPTTIVLAALAGAIGWKLLGTAGMVVGVIAGIGAGFAIDRTWPQFNQKIRDKEWLAIYLLLALVAVVAIATR